ncbi:MAG TPA: hypothetical protein VFD70_18720 [Anaerolineae bacterium]|nr:hypothetical protein [Anaerolineae bacterium]
MKIKILIAGAMIVIALAVALPLRGVLANGSLLPVAAGQPQVKSHQAAATVTPTTSADCANDTPDQQETKSATDTDNVDQQCGDQNGPDEVNGTPEANEPGKQGKAGNQVKTKDVNEQGETNDDTKQGGTADGQPNSSAQNQTHSQ